MNVVCPGCGEESRLPDKLKGTTYTCPQCKTRFPLIASTGNRGLYLKDFFSRVLPEDIDILSPTLDYTRWQRLKRNLGMTVWFTFSFLIAALLYMSYTSNKHAIEQFVPHIKSIPNLKDSGSLSEKIHEMHAFREQIVALKTFNKHWWPPRMGLNQSREVEDQLVEFYLDQFSEGLLKEMDTKLQIAVAQIDATASNHELAQYIEYLVKRINLIQTKALKKTSTMPQPPPLMLQMIDPSIHSQLVQSYDELYLQYLDWNPYSEHFRVQRNILEKYLARLIELKGMNMSWLIAFVENQPDLLPVTISMFWNEQELSHPSDTSMVSPAYTQKGKDRIADFSKQLKSALANTLKKDPNFVSSRTKRFHQDYNLDYVDAWLKFSQAFLRFEKDIQKRVGKYIPENEESNTPTRSWDEWHRLAETMTTLANPYYNYLDRLAEELKHLKGKPKTPPWLAVATDFPTLKTEIHAPQKGILGKTLSLTKAAGRNEIIKSDPLPSSGKTNSKKLTQGVIDEHFKALSEFDTFSKSLKDIGPALESTTTAYRMAVSLFASSGNDSSQESTPFSKGYSAMSRLQKQLTKPNLREQFYWDILRGPMDFLLFFIMHEAACELNLEWYDDVLAEVENLPEEKIFPKLFGSKGIVWDFVKEDGPAGPFFKSRAQGAPRSVYGQQIPFAPDFSSFLRKGLIGKKKIEPQYEISLQAYPVNVNLDAKEKPYAVILELYCSDGDQRLENFNQPISKEITWKPDSCGGVRQEIKFKKFSLVKTWSRRAGFPAFLRDFVDGEKTYRPSDFGSKAKKLKKIGIKKIRIRYAIDGHMPVIDIKNDLSIDIPEDVAKCWEGN